MPKSKSASKKSTKKAKKTKVAKSSKSTLPLKVESKKQHVNGNVFWAMFLIFIGLVLFGNTTQIIPWGIWAYMYRFWPLLLILTGLHIFLGGSKVSDILLNIVGVIMLVSVFSLSLLLVNADLLSHISVPGWIRVLAERIDNNLGEEISKTYEFSSEEYKNVNSLDLSIEISAGEIEFSDFLSDRFLTLDADYFSEFGEPQIAVAQTDTLLSIDIQQQEKKIMQPPTQIPDYKFRVGQLDIPTNLNIDIGAGTGLFDIENMLLERFDINVGAGTLEINLDRDGLPQSGNIDIGAGSVVVNIPDDVAYRIRYSGGLGNVRLEGKDIPRLGEDNRIFESSNYSMADYKLDIELDVGLGNFELNQR